MNHSKQDMSYQDPETNEKYVPYVIEPSLGADRVVLAFLCNSYDEEEISEGDTRVVLHLHPALAPYKVAVLPLSKKLSEKAEEVYTKLSKKLCVIMMYLEVLENVIEEKMKLEHLIV